MAPFIKRIILIIFLIIANLSEVNSQEYQNEKGIIGLMYHRFEENKYPTTNVRLKEFNLQLEIINQNKIEFISIDELRKILIENKSYDSKKVLITVDDAFRSFYDNGWKVLKEKKIPFVLFFNTREVNSNNPNYMTWDQVREIHNSKIGTIGGHSFSHEYLVNKSEREIKEDLEKSHKDFLRELSFKPNYFSYPFGEYSSAFKKIVKEFNYELAFGQHSGVIDKSKDLFELPRYPVNESYGKAERFLTLLNTKPFPFKSFKPENKFITKFENPPKIEIEFFKEITNLEKINCFANDGGEWSKKKISFIEKNWIKVNLDKKFTTRTGRINCSLLDKDNQWRWLGFQFIVDGN
jgi:peptidoglycan/xylan/chitin deacetylase (PgdA/CDA1 family)